MLLCQSLQWSRDQIPLSPLGLPQKSQDQIPLNILGFTASIPATDYCNPPSKNTRQKGENPARYQHPHLERLICRRVRNYISPAKEKKYHTDTSPTNVQSYKLRNFFHEKLCSHFHPLNANITYKCTKLQTQLFFHERLCSHFHPLYSDVYWQIHRGLSWLALNIKGSPYCQYTTMPHNYNQMLKFCYLIGWFD